MSVRFEETSSVASRIAVTGELVPEDADRVREVLRRAPKGIPVEIDFHDAHRYEAHTLVLIARAVAASGGRPTYLGLTEPARRLLRYLGLAPEEPPVGRGSP